VFVGEIDPGLCDHCEDPLLKLYVQFTISKLRKIFKYHIKVSLHEMSGHNEWAYLNLSLGHDAIHVLPIIHALFDLTVTQQSEGLRALQLNLKLLSKESQLAL